MSAGASTERCIADVNAIACRTTTLQSVVVSKPIYGWCGGGFIKTWLRNQRAFTLAVVRKGGGTSVDKKWQYIEPAFVLAI